MRPASHRRLLQAHRDKILCVELKGELFFGSSQQVLQQVRQRGVAGRTRRGGRGGWGRVHLGSSGKGDKLGYLWARVLAYGLEAYSGVGEGNISCDILFLDGRVYVCQL